MSENVRIGYEIDVAGISDFKSLTEAIRAAVEQQQRFEQQSNQAGQSAEKASALIGQLVGFYDKLKSAGNTQTSVLPTEQLEQGKKLLGDLLGQLESIRKESFAPTFDDTGLNKGQASAEKLKKQFESLAAEIDKLNTKSVLNVVPDKGIASGVRGLQVQERIDSFAGVVPDHERDQLSERVNQVVQRDVFTEQLRSANTGPEAALAEAQAREQGGEQAVLALRQKNLEAIRAEALAKAPVLEEQNLINAAVDRQLKLESNTSALKERLHEEQELLTAKERVAKLVDETNARELSGVEKINAQRARFQEQYGKTPELRQKIDQSFDKRVEEEQATEGNPRRLLLGAKDLLNGYPRGALIQGTDYLTSLRGSGATAALAVGGTVAAVGLLSAKLTELVKSEAAEARETTNTASRLGITAGEAEKLASAANLVGVSFSSVESGARIVAQALEDPAGAGKKAASALDHLGIATVDLNGKAREMGPVFLDILKALSRIPDTAQRVALSQQLLGRGAKEIEPLIADYAELNKTVENLGIGDDEQIKKLAAADKAFKTLHASYEELKRSFAERLAPVVVPGIEALTQLLSGRDDHARTDEQRGQILARARQNKQAHQDFTEVTNDDFEAASTQIEQERKNRKPVGPAIPASVQAQYQADAAKAQKILASGVNEFSHSVEGIEAELGAARQKLREQQALVQRQASPANRVTPQAATEAVSALHTDQQAVADLEKRLKAARASESGRGENRYQNELDRINQELTKAEHPVSEFGRAPEVEAQFKKQIDSYQRDFQGKERDTLIARATEAKGKAVTQANSEFAGSQAYRHFQETRVNTDAGLESTRLQMETSQRLAKINSPEKDETVQSVNEAYQQQLDLAKQIHDAHVADLATLREQLAAAKDHSHDSEVSKLEADEKRKYDAERAKADSERVLRTAEINKRERDETRKTAEEIGRIQEEASLHSFQLQSEHTLRLADINRPDTASPVAGIESAYRTQLQLAQLEHDFALQQNADIFKDDEGKRKIADERARQELIERGQQAEYEREERIADLRKQERDYAKDQAASLYDALKQGPKGIREFFQQQADQVGRNLFSEIVGPIIQKADQTINPSGGGILGAATQGTIFGASNGSSQQPGQPNAQQQPGFLGKLQQSLGLKPPPQPIATPAFTASTEPLIGSLERNKGSVDALTAAILNITPGGGVGPVSSPIGHSASPTSEAAPALDELGAHSLVRSSKNAVQAVQGLVGSQNSDKPALANQFSQALEDFASKTPSVSPHGFATLGEVASSDPSSLRDLFSDAVKSAVDAVNPIPAIKRYAYDIPNEELGKAGEAYKKGNLLESAGHVIASIPGTGLVSDTLTAQAQLGQRAAKEFQEGKYSDALAHELNAVVPVIGPQSAAMADKLRSGDPKQIAQAVGEFGGIAAAGTLPIHKLPEAAGELSHLAKAAGEHPFVQALKDETGSFGPGSGYATQQTPTLYHGSTRDLATLQPGTMMTDQPEWAAGYTTKIHPDLSGRLRWQGVCGAPPIHKSR
jgi:hypothetical protein